MTADDWKLFLSLIGFGSAVLLMLSQLLLRLTLDRRVRKALSPDKVYDSYLDDYCGYLRAVMFGNAIVFPWVRKSPAIKNYYDGFDVASFATSFEKGIAYMQTVSFGILMVCMFIFFITKWLGVLEW